MLLLFLYIILHHPYLRWWSHLSSVFHRVFKPPSGPVVDRTIFTDQIWPGTGRTSSVPAAPRWASQSIAGFRAGGVFSSSPHAKLGKDSKVSDISWAYLNVVNWVKRLKPCSLGAVLKNLIHWSRGRCWLSYPFKGDELRVTRQWYNIFAGLDWQPALGLKTQNSVV